LIYAIPFLLIYFIDKFSFILTYDTWVKIPLIIVVWYSSNTPQYSLYCNRICDTTNNLSLLTTNSVTWSLHVMCVTHICMLQIVLKYLKHFRLILEQPGIIIFSFVVFYWYRCVTHIKKWMKAAKWFFTRVSNQQLKYNKGRKLRKYAPKSICLIKCVQILYFRNILNFLTSMHHCMASERAVWYNFDYFDINL
jgi:hypothetical protein